MKLTREQKEQWLTALRSGKYQQTNGNLHDNNGYCCLGVLCDILPDVVQLDKGVTDVWLFKYKQDISNAVLPATLAKDLEAQSLGFKVDMFLDAVKHIIIYHDDVWTEEAYEDSFQIYGTQIYTIAELNDEGYSFDCIADLVELFVEVSN